MIIKGIDDCDFVNYYKPSMFVAFPKCTMKCDALNGVPVCQNCQLNHSPNISICAEELCKRYIENPLAEAIVCGGLEPFDTTDALFNFAITLRQTFKCNDDFVIYTGYTKEELERGWRATDNQDSQMRALIFQDLLKLGNIVIKFGRYIMNDVSHFDEVLGIELASQNQYAERLS